MWNKYIQNNTKLADRFNKIWGDYPLPRPNRMVELSRKTSTIHRLKWLSQNLYTRRVKMFGKGLIDWNEWVKKSSDEVEMIRKELSKIGVSTFEQNKLLYDCGTRGALEIRLMKMFTRKKSYLSYMDKNYEEEIEDLEQGLFAKKATQWNTSDFISLFTVSNIAILGFFNLLELALKKYQNVIKYMPSPEHHGFYVNVSKGWIPCPSLWEICRLLENSLKKLIPEFKQMSEEYLEFTSCKIPDDPSDFSTWFDRLFVSGNCSSTEFVNLFETVWMLTEYTEDTTEPVLYKLVRQRAAQVVEQTNEELRKTVPYDLEFYDSNRVKGETTIKQLFCPNAIASELQTKSIQFATRWRMHEKSGRIRQNVVQIDRWK